MENILKKNRHCGTFPDNAQGKITGMLFRSHRKIGLWLFILLSHTFVATPAGENLLNEDFSDSAKGTFLEQRSGKDWEADEGRLIIGNGRDLNGQALSYAPNRTWAYQVYSHNLAATLASEEAVEVSFSAAVKIDASPAFYIYAMRIYDGADYVQLELKGGESAPQVILESVVDGQKKKSDAEGLYYEKGANAGLAAVRMVVTGDSAQAYIDRNGKKDWVPVGDPVVFRLNTVDKVQVRYYAMGFWSAMDDLKVAIVKPAP